MNIMKLRPFFLVISTILLGSSLFSVITWKFKPSIDFAGGSIWEVSLPGFVEGFIKQEETVRGHEINYMVMGKGEFKLRRQKRDQFIVDFFLSNPVAIIGSSQEISNL